MSIEILKEMSNDFLVYSGEVNTNRAFPDARDGLKPSQRACLWEMYSRGYFSNKPHVKSAKVDGGVIANWHPHGSEYSTIVRMSQPWVNNISEVDWHGGNGSILGGPEAAASRYTECRLSKVSEDGFFTNMKKNPVDMILNFSEDLEWPRVLPAIMPRLFVNGSQGIGYTISQEWEPGNLVEFTSKVKGYLKNKKVDCSDIYPDYPTGGVIINKDEIHTIYETGRGNIILRGKVEIEGNIIKITELPYQVYAEPFIQKIKDLVNKDEITGIEDICNKSDDNGLLIEIECSDRPETVLNRLYKLTELQSIFSANTMALVNGVPELLTLKDYIKVYIDHNIECIKREYTFDLHKAEERLEVVDGLVKALAIIDDIITTIKCSKSSDEARKNLVKKFKFTEIQAKAIVDMRLGKLANLEGVELSKEQTELNKTVEECNKILSSVSLQQKEFIRRLDAFTKEYGWERRTHVTNVEVVKEEKVKKDKTDESVMIVVTRDNYLKRVKLVDFKSNDPSILKSVMVNTSDKVILISETGMMYKMKANKIKLSTMKSTGTLLEDKIINLFTGQEEEPNMFMITSLGKVKKMTSEDVFSTGRSSGISIFKLDDGDRIIDCRLITEEKISVSIGKKTKTIDTSEYKPRGRKAGGVKGVKIKEGQSININ